MNGGYDPETRMAQIVGQPPRVDPLPDAELTDEARAITGNLNRAFGMDGDAPVPEVLRIMLRHAALFRVQMEMGIELVSGRLPPRDREIAILRNAWLIGAPYEWGEHVEIGKSCGLTPEEILRVIAGSAAPGWSGHDAAICRGVEELQADAMISDETWAVLASTWDDAQLVEFPILVGQYTSTAFLQNSVRARLGSANPGLSHR